MKLRLTLALSAVALSACATLSEVSPDEALAADMAGTFETAIGTDEAMRDRRFRLTPLGDGEWLYYQVNHKADLSVYRQRVLQLEPLADGRVRQSAWTVKEAEAHVDLWRNADAVAALDLDDLSTGLEEGCAQIWERIDTGWTGTVDPATCIITSKRRGTEIRIGADSKLTETTLELAERGFNLEGEQMWGTEPGSYHSLARVD